MPKTYTKIAFGFLNRAIKQSCVPTGANLQPFSKVLDIKYNTAVNRQFATFEDNFWLLDGSVKFFPSSDSDIHVGIMGSTLSSNTGILSQQPVLTITFSALQTIDGLTLRGLRSSDDYSNHISISYYGLSDNLLLTRHYYPNNWEYVISESISFSKLTITFISTNKPYRYARLVSIEFGKVSYFTDANLKSCVLVQETSPISLDLPSDVVDIDLFSENDDFNIINPSGAYAALQNRQPMDVYQITDNIETYIGQFFMDTWQNKANRQAHFHCIDLIGVLDSQTVAGGIVNAQAQYVISDVLTALNIPYELSPLLGGVVVKGWIPRCSAREALHLIAFTIGAYVTCSGSEAIKILPSVIPSNLIPSSIPDTLSGEMKGIDNSIELKERITGVEVVSHDYYVDETAEFEVNVVNAYHNAGSYLYSAQTPMSGVVSVSGASIVDFANNWIRFTVPVAQVVTIKVWQYKVMQQVFSVYEPNLDGNIQPNVMRIDSITTISRDVAQSVAQRVYDYCTARYVQSVRQFIPITTVGYPVLVDVAFGRKIIGVTTKMTSNLSRGFTCDTEITGVLTE